jgi:hypothetical protein
MSSTRLLPWKASDSWQLLQLSIETISRRASPKKAVAPCTGILVNAPVEGTATEGRPSMATATPPVTLAGSGSAAVTV